jgi:hypothetical protein
MRSRQSCFNPGVRGSAGSDLDSVEAGLRLGGLGCESGVVSDNNIARVTIRTVKTRVD